MRNKLALLIAILPVLSVAQASDEAFVFAVVPRMELIIKEVRECQDVPQPQQIVAENLGASSTDEAVSPQWVVSDNGIGKVATPTSLMTGTLSAHESCRLTERKEKIQDGWQVFLRYNSRNFNMKIAGSPPQVGVLVPVTISEKGDLEIVKVIDSQK